MSKHRRTLSVFVAIQLVVVCAFAISYAGLSRESKRRLHRSVIGESTRPIVEIERTEPLQIAPLYDDPQVVSDEELAAVLKKLRPRFSPKNLKPNFVEHALRTWGVDATFDEPGIMSGVELRNVLTDHAAFLKSWDDEVPPLLVDRQTGISVRDDRKPGGSVHHDHWLASLTEAGVSLNTPVFSPGRSNSSINDVLQEALRDFRLDERETEWSTMAFGLWLPPTKFWTTGEGRQLSFDQMARRLIRGHHRFGVCSGTHRVYSLVVLLRLDDEFGILSGEVREEIMVDLKHVRDLIVASQFKEGYWPSNWSAGASAVKDPISEPTYKRVIATGHHLEWLAIAPRELHPRPERIRKAAKWVIRTTLGRLDEEIGQQYTFYSHVATALSLWRKTRPIDFWRSWRKAHPANSAREVGIRYKNTK